MPENIDTEILRGLIATGKKALHGDSNDAEHDALYEIVEMLEVFLHAAEKKSQGAKAARL